MKHLKIFENFGAGNIPDSLVLRREILEFLKAKMAYPNISKDQTFGIQPEGSIVNQVKKLNIYLKESGYSVETYPKLTPAEAKYIEMINKMDFTSKSGYDYEPLLLVDCYEQETKNPIKLGIYFPEMKTPSVEFLQLKPNKLKVIAENKLNSSEIECLFWNGKEIVEGKFEATYINDDRGKEYDEPVQIAYDSYETTDNQKYIIDASFFGSDLAGYEGGEIEDIDFA